MSKFLDRNFLVSFKRPKLLLASNMSSTYITRKMNWLPLTFMYTHSSTMFSIKPNELITESNFKYHCLEACFNP
ncbi:hypothetical protein RchiOBHm_Chr7g0195061 [Rosa chinensis]|uniref:Uncharacterized protein n=1 Tax=Rosa chinensis TaxID=74649 RepID=A0A2P6P6B1_ROSCH|nr:hypothetical protein RchiOBHm_Chr7g0195061 [Rosa chinensis]